MSHPENDKWLENKKEYFEEINGFCNKCGYMWHPRTKKPKCCPKCKSYHYRGVKPCEDAQNVEKSF